MDILFEHLNTGDAPPDFYREVWGANVYTQTFSPQQEHNVTKLGVQIVPWGNSPLWGAVTAGIDGVESAIMDSAQFIGVPGGYPGIMAMVTLSGTNILLAGVSYTLRVSAPDASAGHHPRWAGNSMNLYPRGQSSANPAWDFMFEEWGSVLPIGQEFVQAQIIG